MDLKNIEINDDFAAGLNLLENHSDHLFITGKAGTGKSTLLQYFRKNTKKKIAVLAPTGVAAVNISGQTIHSFFKFRIDISFSKIRKIKNENRLKLYQKLDMIIIDEISMVRADLLDLIDHFLKLNCENNDPFGGKQMVFFGDLYQLPPIITQAEKSIFKTNYSTGYFFSAKIMEEIHLQIITLKKIYRQSNQEFIEILNQIRNNTISTNLLVKLNKKYQPSFNPGKEDFYIYLTSRNIQAQSINNLRLEMIDEQEFTSYAFIEGEFTKNNLPADEILIMKKSAQVMFLNNDSEDRWINGTMGEIIEIDLTREIVKVLLIEKNEEVDVFMHRWDLIRYTYDLNTQKIETEIAGSFHQFPLKLAWAVTIHKSQGKTFQKVIIDIGHGTFSPGQLYVALSRCTSLDGIILKERIRRKDIMTDLDVIRYFSSYSLDSKDQTNILTNDDKAGFLESILKDQKKVSIKYENGRGMISNRTVQPLFVGKLKYADNSYLGLTAFCYTRNEKRNFRIDRILEIMECNNQLV